MKMLSFDAFNALHIEEPIISSFEGDAVIHMHRNSKGCNNWLAVPIEEEMGIPHIGQLASYCSTNNAKIFYAFSPRFKKESEIFSATPTIENLKNIEGKFSLRAYTIIPEPACFHIISDGDYYTILAGSEDFLRFVMGCKITEGINRFAKAIERYPSSRHEAAHLSKILRVCKDFNTES